MALSLYTKTCAKNTAGNYNKVFLANPGDITALTLTTGEISALTVASPLFQAVHAEIDSVNFKIEGTGGQNYFTKQTLTMKFAKKTAALMTFLNNLTTAVACGVIAVRVDGNGVAWLSGYDASGTDKIARPYNMIKANFDSGTKPSDAEGNFYTIELSRESEWDETPFDSTLSAALLGGTATAWVDYS
jgi:hypothetical protein